MLESKGQFALVKEELKKRSIKCFVKEVFPYFIISDGQYFIASYFTENAIKEFRKKNKTKLWDLKDKIILIDQWSMDIRTVSSEQ